MGSMSLASYKIDDFSGGINTADAPGDLQPNEMLAASNGVEFVNNGKALRSRRRLSEWQLSTALPAPGSNTEIQSVLAVENQSRLFVSNQDGGIWVYNMASVPASGTNVVDPSLASGLWRFAYVTESGGTPRAWAMNGNDTPKKMDIFGLPFTWGGTPPNGTILIIWKNRMIVSGVSSQPQRLYYSDINNPESFPANNFIDIKATDDDSDNVVTFALLGEDLLVFKNKSVWIVYDSTTFANRRVAPIGCIGDKCACVADNLAYWISQDGVYSTDGDTVQLESRKISNIFYGNLMNSNTNPQLARLTYMGDGKIWMREGAGPDNFVLHTRMKQEGGDGVWLRYGFSTVFSPAFFYVDFQGDTWTNKQFYGVFRIPTTNTLGIVSIFAENSFTHNDQDVYVSAANGAINSQYFSSFVDITGDRERFKRLRRLVAQVAADNYPTFAWKNAGESSNSTSLPTHVEGESGGLDTGNAEPKEMSCRPEKRGRLFSVGLTAAGRSWILTSMELVYRGGKEH